MSFYIYVGPSNLSQNFPNAEFQNFSNPSIDQNLFTPQEIYYTPTFTTQFTLA